MSAGQVIDTIIEKAARFRKKLKTEHLCSTCGRYHRKFCAVGRELTDGLYYHEELSDYISNDWHDSEVPDVMILVTKCSLYKPERR